MLWGASLPLPSRTVNFCLIGCFIIFMYPHNFWFPYSGYGVLSYMSFVLRPHLKFYCIYVSVLPARVPVHRMYAWCLQRTDENMGLSETVVTDA